MPNFHDPQTREQMQREGWEFPNTHSCHKWTDGTRAVITLFNERFHLDIDHRNGADGFTEISLPMKSFAAALNAANAILEGVEG